MLPIDLTLDGSAGVTLLSNIFIDHYMKDANDVQIKVYLYLLRTVSAGRAADLNTLADFLNCSERDIIRALRYWANQGVLSLSYDQALMVSGNDFYEGRLSGICLQNLHKPMPATALSMSNSMSNMQNMTTMSTQTVSVNNRLQSGFAASASVASAPAAAASVSGVASVPSLPDPDKRKSSYTLDDLKRFKADPDNCFLLTAAQQYLGIQLSEPQYRSLLFLSEGLGFSAELTDYLLQYCVGNKQKSFHYIEATALAWAEQGISTVEEAKALVHPKDDRESAAIMTWMGRSGNPAPEEARLIHRWLRIYASPMPLIEEACRRAVLAVSNNRFSYADKILKSWNDQGLQTLEAVNAADEAYRQSTRPLSAPAGSKAPGAHSSKRSSYSNMKQHDYDFSELEKKLINN